MHRFFLLFSCFVILVVLIMSLEHDCYAETIEMNYQKFKIAEWDYWGCFDKPCIIDPGDFNIFGVYATSVGDAWYYLGRTGEKTFNIFKSMDFGKKEIIYSVYFTPNDTLRLKHVLGAKGCLSDDAIYLKMLNLNGNKLTFQILLPDCVKKARSQ
ncbi:MAG: hypothetical protein WC581_06955 [Thermodesulfovibrionales bacterium]